jgi:hypothetical protein
MTAATAFRPMIPLSGDATPICAQLTGSRCCEALGIVATGPTPVLSLCRKLMAAGHDPGTPLHAYRGDVLALRALSIGGAARLTVTERDRDRPRFEPWDGPRPFGAGPLARKNDAEDLPVTPRERRAPPEAAA